MFELCCDTKQDYNSLMPPHPPPSYPPLALSPPLCSSLTLDSTSQVVGTIDGSGRVKLVDRDAPPGTPPAVDLDLDKVLGKMPDKTYTFSRSENKLSPLDLPTEGSIMEALHKVLKLPSVCSKRFLTTKVDRHVTGEWPDLGPALLCSLLPMMQ